MKIVIDTIKLSGSDFHSKGKAFREEEKYLEALCYLTLSLHFLQKESNHTEIVDVLKDRCLIWKHLFLISKDKIYAILAGKDAETMLAITEEFGLKDKYHTSYFRLGEIAMLYDDYPKAIRYYKKALVTYTGSISEKGVYRYHLGEAIYREGDKREGKRLMLKGLEEIRKGTAEHNTFLINVWESGVHLRLAELLRKDDYKESKFHLEIAKKIIQSDEKLIIRRRQMEELTKQLGF